MTSPKSESRDNRVAQLLEEISVRMLDGETIDYESLIDSNPDIASQLRELAATVHGLAEWGNHTNSHNREDVSANQVLGDFRIVREIGRGGMGVVYEAEQLSLSRNVALKVLPFAALLDKRQLRRFQTEARAAAILQHENIVSVYSVGCERGIHYYAMQLIDGVDLSEVIVQLHKPESPGQPPTYTETQAVAKLSTRRAGNRTAFYRSVADLGARLARAVDYAHQEGVVHRDIKPANLLLDKQGQIHIADFGLARVRSSRTDLTAETDILGTLRYMSPEQVAGDKVADHRTDIYSLGITLFELITGQPARNAETREALLTQINEASSLSLAAHCPDIPSDLETIIIKATDADPSLRYPSAVEMANDLECFKTGRPILARRATLWETTCRWLLQNPTVAALLGVVLALLLLITAGSVVASSRFRGQAESLRDQVHWNQQVIYARDIATAQQAIRDGNYFAAESVLLKHADASSGTDQRGFEWYHLWQAAHDPALERTISHQLNVNDVEFVGKSNKLAVGAWSDHIRIWDLDREPQSPPEVDISAPHQWTRTVVHLPKRKSLLTIDLKGICHEFSLETNEPVGVGFAICEFETTEKLFCRGIVTPDNKTVIIAGGSNQRGLVTVLDMQTLTPIATNQELAGRAHAAMVNGRLFIGTEESAELLELGSQDLSIRNRFSLPGSGGTAMASSPDGQTLAIAVKRYAARSAVADILLWNVDTGQVVDRIGIEGEPFGSLCFSPDGNLLASGQRENGTIRLYAAEDLTLRRKKVAHGSSVYDLAFTSDSKKLVTAGSDGAVHVWNVERFLGPGQDVTYLNAELGCAHGVFVDNIIACVGSRGGELIFWNTNNGQETNRLRLEGPKSNFTRIYISDDRKTMAVAMEAYPEIKETKLVILDVAKNEEMLSHSFFKGDSGSAARAFSRDGRFYVHFIKSRAYVFDLRQRKLVHEFDVAGFAKSLSFSVDNQTCVFADLEGHLHEFSVPEFRLLKTVRGDDRLLVRALHSPDDGQLAAVGFDRRVDLFDTSTLDRLLPADRFPLTARYLCEVAYSPDGERLVTGSPDGTIRLWHVASGQELLSFRTATSYYPDVAFSPNGEKLLVACGPEAFVVHSSGRDQLQKLTVAELQDIACQNVVGESRSDNTN